MHYYVECWKKYAVFAGRARRREFWMFFLFGFMASILAAVVDALVTGSSIVFGFYGLAQLLPAISVTVRRLHDTGKSGWWYWIAFVPFVGGFLLLAFCCFDSQPGENAYGPNPKE